MRTADRSSSTARASRNGGAAKWVLMTACTVRASAMVTAMPIRRNRGIMTPLAEVRAASSDGFVALPEMECS